MSDTADLAKLTRKEARLLLKFKGPYHKIFNKSSKSEGSRFGNIFT